MLQATPLAWYSAEFQLVQDDGRKAGVLKLARLKERATFAVQDVSFELYRENMLGDFVLAFEGAVFARAEKQGGFARRFVVTVEEQSYVLEAASSFTRAFVLREADGDDVGSIRPDHALTRRSEIDLPEEIPLPVQAFFFWLVLVLWNRAAAAS